MKCFNESENGILFSMAQLPYKGFCNYETLWVLLLVQQTCKAGDTSITSNRPFLTPCTTVCSRILQLKSKMSKKKDSKGEVPPNRELAATWKVVNDRQWPLTDGQPGTWSHSDVNHFQPFSMPLSVLIGFCRYATDADDLMAKLLHCNGKKILRSFLSIVTWQPL